ncbi:MAG TPA: DUF5916 domain-containing protein [Saprospiraceae bacterium]|nr:DUF5916 domain-containing protein [Saprospiraceae bacterium]
MKVSLGFLCCSAGILSGVISFAQPGADDRPVAKAMLLVSTPVMDGEVMNDPVWQSIESFGDFWQVQPYAGERASERTDVRIAYDANTLFLSVVCHDAEPDNLVVSDALRDASLDNNDSFLFILDTYKDGQNGFMFGTNSAGTEYDAQVDNEGIGNSNLNRQQGGVIGGFNLNWDASWEVKTDVGDYGWSAEFAIPLRTLRYAAGESQVWGINFRRNIRKTNEIVYWSKLPIGFDLKRLSLAGTLTGLNLQSPGNLKVIPYVLGRVSKDFTEADPKTEFEPEVGVDVKYSITPALTLDLTYNTDFAQVEVDEQQVNLDRFNLFFPEKRPFFLENAGLFGSGSPGEVDLFFSRRIGISPNGAVVPIVGGVRLSGKIKKTNIGALSMFTDNMDDVGIHENNYSVARVQHEFGRRSFLGGSVIGRYGMGDEQDDHNTVFAIDGKIGLGQKALISGFASKSSTPGIDAGDHAFKGLARYEWNGWEVQGAYMEVGEGFNPEVGFLLRESFRKPEGLILYHWRMNGWLGLLELRPHISYRGYWDFDGFQQTGLLHIDNHWEWKSGIIFHDGINFTREGVVEAFEISKDIVVPAGTYDHTEGQFVFETNQSKKISISTRHIIGGFFGGHRYSNTATLRMRFSDKLNTEFGLNRNDVDLPGGEFNTNIFRSRIAYAFTPRIYAQGLIQYNDVADLWSVNLRFGWLAEANTGLFVVYNQTANDGLTRNRSFIVKYSRVFDVLR